MALRALIVIVLVAASGAYAYQLGTQHTKSNALPTFSSLPARFDDGWTSVDYGMAESTAEVLDADVTLQRVYHHRNGDEVSMFLAYFKEQQVNSQIHSPRHCVPGGGWSVTSLEQRVLDVAGRQQPVSRMRIERNAQAREMLYWFRTRGGTITGEYALKWDLVLNSLARRPTDAVFVRFSSNVDDPEIMRDMIERIDAPLNRILSEVGLP